MKNFYRILLPLGLVALCGGVAPCTCSEDESCCLADTVYVCCVNEVTQCVEEAPEGLFPSRCCPKWTVGCTMGSVGCCDPSTPWQRAIPPPQADNEKPLTTTLKQKQSKRSTPTEYVYALFITGPGKILSTVILTVDGKVISYTAVIGDAAEWYARWYGEGTRVFPFDSKHVLFHILDAPNSTAPVTLYSIDARSGNSTSKQLVNELAGTVTGYPLGIKFSEESDRLIFSTLAGNSFTFYSVNVNSGLTTKLGSTTFNKTQGELDPGFYMGYLSGLSLDGKTAYRLGYRNVTYQNTFGFMKNSLKGGTDASFLSIPRPSNAYDLYSFTRLVNTEVYYSLAPSSVGDGSFYVYTWDNSTVPNVTLVAQLDNAFPPTVMSLGILGYVATAVSEYTFITVVMSRVPNSNYQKWSIASVDLTSTRHTTSTNELNPQPPYSLPSGCGVVGLGLTTADASH